MAFPHPQSRKDHYRKEDKAGCGGIVRKLRKRTINVTEYWNAEDDVNPAKDQTLRVLVHHEFPSGSDARSVRDSIECPSNTRC